MMDNLQNITVSKFTRKCETKFKRINTYFFVIQRVLSPLLNFFSSWMFAATKENAS